MPRGVEIGALVAAAAALVAPAGGRAQAFVPESPRVLVLRADVAEAEAADALAVHVLERLRSLGWPVRRPAEPAVPPSERAALDAAQDAYDRLRPDEARVLLDAIAARAAASGGAGLDAAALRELFLLQALVGLASGDEAAVDGALRRLRVAFPDFAPDARFYPPALRARHAATAAPSTAALVEVETVDEALVWVDGRPLPPGERRVELAPGPHLVRAAAGGYAAAGRLVDVAPGAASIALPLAPDDEARLRRAGAPGAPLPPRAQAAAARAGVTVLLLDVIAPAPGAQAVAALADLATGRVAEVVLVAGAPVEARAARLVDALVRARPADARRDPLPWVLGSVAAVAVLAAVVLSVVLVGDRDRPPQAFDLRWEGP